MSAVVRRALVEYLAAQSIEHDGAALTGVFDEPPRHQPFPYAIVGDFMTTRNDLIDQLSEVHTGEISVYTREPDRLLCNCLSAKIAAALHRSTGLVVPGERVYGVRVDDYTVSEDATSEDKTRQYRGTVRVRIMTHEL